jgi:predicted NBD/HSP70 family sugar kinase
MRIVPSISEGDPRMPATWRVLTALLRDPSLGQADLRERTGLSHPVIVQQVALLRKAGLIRMGRPISGQPGRPRVPMAFNWDFRRLLVVDIHSEGITTQATNLCGVEVGPPTLWPVDTWSEEALRTALSMAIREVMATPGATWAGVAVVLPGAVTPDHRSVLSAHDLAHWVDYPLADQLEAEFGVPVLVERHASALARGISAELQDDPHNIVAISLRHEGYIGMGMVVQGRVAYGGPNSGNIGHIRVAGNPRACACGLMGCLGTLFRDARREPVLRRDAVRSLAQVLAGLITVLNPDHLFVQGDSAWTENDHELVRSELQAHGFPGAINMLSVDSRPATAHEVIAGAVALLAEHVLDLRHGLLTDWAQQDLRDDSLTMHTVS